MKIKDIKINGFGKLKEKEINLDDKINIIYGKNEAGKSTLLKFIIGMLYGTSKLKRGKDISDFDKFEPWNFEEFSGKIKYELDNNRQYEIFREFKKKNPKIFNEKMEDISKEFKADKSSGIQFFEEQVGVNEETFVDTAIISQTETKLSKSSQTNIIQKIGNKVSTGDDKLSFKKVIDKISKAQLENVGTVKTSQKPINIVNNEIYQLEIKRNELENDDERKDEIIEDLGQLQNNIEFEQDKISFLKKYKKIISDNKMRKLEIGFNEDLEKEYKQKISNLEKELKVDEKKSKLTLKNRLLFIIPIIFFIAGIIVMILKKFLVISIVLESIALLLFVFLLIFFNKYNKKIENIENGSIKSQIEMLEKEKKEKLDKISKINNEVEEEFENKKENLKQEYFGLIDIEFIRNSFYMDLEEIETSIETKENNLNNLKLKQNLLNAEAEMLETKQEEKNSILEKLESLKLQKDELEKLDRRYEIVKECLNLAYTNMKNNITPKFKEDLTKTIKEFSNGKYENIKFDDETSLTVEIDNGNYISAEKLSVGTIDQMYMAVRLSAIEQISDEKLPIILDEAFAYYDDERLENILKFLSNTNRQIIILTCTNREISMLEKNKINYNFVNL